MFIICSIYLLIYFSSASKKERAVNNHSNPDFDMSTPAPAALELDLAEYAPYVADFDMTEDQKRELLETLWTIMAHFVAMGFDVGKADICGQIFPDFNAASANGRDGVDSSRSSATETAKQHKKGR